MAEESLGSWVECVVDNDYEIYDQYPYSIRRKGGDKLVRESVNKKDGYVQCSMNNKKYQKHRIIAQQFIPNDEPETKPFIDHIDNNRTNNHITNLRWVSASENQRNKSSSKGYQYVFYDELPTTAERLDAYNGYEFDGLYIDYENEKLYKFNGVRYRELICCMKQGNIYYRTYDIEGKYRALSHKNLFD